MKNFMLLPAARTNPSNENNNDEEDLEEPKEAFSDCEHGIVFCNICYKNSFFNF